jgi:hypothetical protein
MAGPLPLPIEHGASSYGQEANIQRSISSAKQYNPASALGITADDQPSKKPVPLNPPAAKGIPSPVESSQPPASPAKIPGPAVGQGSKRTGGFGPESGLGPSVKSTQPFNSGDLDSHYAHLGSLPDASQEIQWYARRSRGSVLTPNQNPAGQG